MKLTWSLRTFTLRSLLVGSTLAAIGLALVGNRLIENRRQEQLVDEVLRAADSEYNALQCVGYNDGKVFVWLIGGELLSEATARKIVEARRIAWMRIHSKTLPAVHDILAEGFVREKGEEATDWHRQGGDEQPTQTEVWDYIEGEKKEA